MNLCPKVQVGLVLNLNEVHLGKLNEVRPCEAARPQAATEGYAQTKRTPPVSHRAIHKRKRPVNKHNLPLAC